MEPFDCMIEHFVAFPLFFLVKGKSYQIIFTGPSQLAVRLVGKNSCKPVAFEVKPMKARTFSQSYCTLALQGEC